MTKEEVIKIWQDFVDKNETIELTKDTEVVEMIAKGVLENEKNHGLKFCPCRMKTKDKEENYKLICPCNFFIQNTWNKKDECWCGLFIKSKNKK